MVARVTHCRAGLAGERHFAVVRGVHAVHIVGEARKAVATGMKRMIRTVARSASLFDRLGEL